MLYPKIVSVNKSRKITTVFVICSIVVSIILLIINYVCNSKLNWSIVAIASIVYIWFSTIYALDKSVNLAGYTLYQMISDSILIFIIDYVFGFRRWSLSIGILIVIMISNITMVIITIIKKRLVGLKRGVQNLLQIK